jgi:hypothetical protein
MRRTSYPIWNNVTACIYTASKSYGVKGDGEVEIVVGTSKSNSHHFVNHCTTHRKLDDGSREYRFYVDNICIKRARLAKGASDLEWLAVDLADLAA